MKKRYFAAVLLVMVCIGLLTLLRKKAEPLMRSAPAEIHNESSREKQETRQEPTTSSRSQTLSSVETIRASSHSQRSNTVIIDGVAVSSDVIDYARKSMADPQYDWKQPINFYGRVVDQDGAPLSEAAVDFKWNDLSPQGTSASQTVSDSKGYFSLVNQTGKRLYVQVHKDGYYTSHQSGVAFEYANPADGLFTPDPHNPVVFHLRKKGEGVDLITSLYGMSPDFPIVIPRDGTPVTLDVMQRKVDNSGQIEISASKPEHGDWQQATSWWFRMKIPTGGFVEQNDEFPFEAPESGYQPVVQFEFQKGQTNWATGLIRDFYIKFGNPPQYGRLQVKTDISYSGGIFTYAINPSGSRNLEPKPK